MTELSELELGSVPYLHQLDYLALAKDLIYFALLFDMGTGKSAALLYNAVYLFSNNKINGLVIIAPKSVCRTWAEIQIPKHLPESLKIRLVIWAGQSKRLDQQLASLSQSEPGCLHILVINVDAVIGDRGYDALETFLRTHHALLGIDESTSIKSPKASRTKILVKLGKLAKYRRILTGTLMANQPMDVFSQFEFLSPGCLGVGSWLAFRNRYAVTATRYVNGRRFEEIIGWQRLDELQKAISKLSFRVLKKDCLDLPDKIYEKRFIELSPEQRKYYNELRDQALTELASGTLVAAPLVITRVLRLRQALCNIAPDSNGGTEFISASDPRLNEVLSLIEQAGDQKILIWSCFVSSITKLVNAINDEYGEGTAAAFYGGVSEKERQELINAFQGDEGKLRVLVIQPRVGGEGITLTKGTLVIYHDNDWGLKVRQQSEDRCHRIGQTKAVTYVDIIAQGTVDETIVTSLTEKKDLAEIISGDVLRRLLTAS